MAAWKKLQKLVKTKELFDLVPVSNVFTPTKDDVIDSRLRLRYSSTCDSYYRDWSNAIDPSSTSVLTGWERGLFSLDNVYRRIDEENGLVYLDRKDNNTTGNLKWQFNIGCCGLLVDQISLKVKAVADFGGEIIVTLIGDSGRQRIKYQGEGNHVTFEGLVNSSVVTLSIHLVGENGQLTRLFPQSIMKGMDYPLDVQFVLKPPLESLGKPRILLGLMYSNAQEIQVDARHYKEKSKSSGKGFLHVHFLKGKDLLPETSVVPETVIKCFCLLDAKKTIKCRTKQKKCREPIWDEQFLIVGVPYHELKRTCLEICLTEYNARPTRRVRLFGGLRLSLGLENITASQRKNINQVLKAFWGKEDTEVETQKTETELVTNHGRQQMAVSNNSENILLDKVLQHNTREELKKEEVEDNTMDSDCLKITKNKSNEKQTYKRDKASESEDKNYVIEWNEISTRSCSTPNTVEYDLKQEMEAKVDKDRTTVKYIQQVSPWLTRKPQLHSKTSYEEANATDRNKRTEGMDSNNDVRQEASLPTNINIFSYECNLYDYQTFKNKNTSNDTCCGSGSRFCDTTNIDVNEALGMRSTKNISESTIKETNLIGNDDRLLGQNHITKSESIIDFENASASSQIDSDELRKRETPNLETSFQENLTFSENMKYKLDFNSDFEDDTKYSSNESKPGFRNSSEETFNTIQKKNNSNFHKNLVEGLFVNKSTNSSLNISSGENVAVDESMLALGTNSEDDQNVKISSLEPCPELTHVLSRNSSNTNVAESNGTHNGHLKLNTNKIIWSQGINKVDGSSELMLSETNSHQNRKSKSLPCSPFKTKIQTNANLNRTKIETIQKSGSETTVSSINEGARNSESLSRGCSIRKCHRESKEKRKKEKENLKKELTEAMFDGTAREITQWEMVIQKPRQWIFCWQFLRDLQPIHHKL